MGQNYLVFLHFLCMSVKSIQFNITQYNKCASWDFPMCSIRRPLSSDPSFGQGPKHPLVEIILPFWTGFSHRLGQRERETAISIHEENIWIGSGTAVKKKSSLICGWAPVRGNPNVSRHISTRSRRPEGSGISSCLIYITMWSRDPFCPRQLKKRIAVLLWMQNPAQQHIRCEREEFFEDARLWLLW